MSCDQKYLPLILRAEARSVRALSLARERGKSKTLVGQHSPRPYILLLGIAGELVLVMFYGLLVD